MTTLLTIPKALFQHEVVSREHVMMVGDGNSTRVVETVVLVRVYVYHLFCFVPASHPTVAVGIFCIILHIT